MEYSKHSGKYVSGSITLYQANCMDILAETPDKYYDLCVVDPPYGLGNKLVAGGTWSVKYQDKGAEWDVAPGADYFSELFRVSKNWIIWGGNYFSHHIPPARHFIPWVKPNMSGMHTMSDVELALTSFDMNSKAIHLTSQTESGSERIHVCQKPIALYRRLLNDYAKPGQRILDTHLGSGSSAIAAHYFGCDFVGIELDPDYYISACERFARETSQMAMAL